MGKKMVSDDERRKNLMDRMFSTAKEVDDEDEERKRKEQEKPKEDEEVAEEEWVSRSLVSIQHIFYLTTLDSA